MVDTRDLRLFLSALSEKRDVECRKFKETLTDLPKAILSQASERRKVQRLDTVHLKSTAPW